LLQAMPQFEPSQVAVPLEAGAGHGEQRVPHEAALVLDAQMPLQLWVAPAHVPLQAALASMHTPLQSCLPGHDEPQARPSQVATPPVGAVQAMHDDVPQLAMSVLLTQVAPHR
jgi:hypothetical protein